MRKLIVYLFAIMVIAVAACKGTNNNNSGQADSGQTHVGNENQTDSAKYPATPAETGGKDTSGNGAGNTNAPKDTLKTNP